MRVRKIVISSIAAFFVILVLFVFSVKKMQAQESVSSGSGVYAKLQEIADTQKASLGEIRSIKEELSIIKVRVTQQQ